MTAIALDIPFLRFAKWFDEANRSPAIIDATAMCLATSTLDGNPSARIVLLKAWSETGFVFYTNNTSRKGQELTVNPKTALCIHWPPLEKQIRIEGKAEPVSSLEADAYFKSRARDSRIGAWASLQSSHLASRAELEERIREFAAKHPGDDIPRPPHWSGWRVVPERMEFWSQGEFRLHDRDVYHRVAEGWRLEKLYP